MEIRAIVPAAGKGTRLHTTENDAPKVMRLCGGKPLLETVLGELSFVDPSQIYIVVGYKKDDVINYFGPKYHYVEQKEQLETAHAIMVCADSFTEYNGTVLVTFGDMPLFRQEDMKAMCRQHEKEGCDCTLMTAENPDLKLWARIVRAEKGNFRSITEGKDCSPAQAGMI